MSAAPPWSQVVRLGELTKAPSTLRLQPDAAARGRLAAAYDLVSLDAFEVELQTRPWLDGVEVQGRWSARIVQICGLTADPFDSAPSGDFLLRLVPPGSAAAVTEDAAPIDPNAPDPPDVLEDDRVDLAALAAEQLALSLDPFPRKPGAQFEAPPEDRPPSPFAVLERLKPKGE